MKKLAFLILLSVSLFAEAQIDAVLPKRPAVPRLVNDYANVLTPEQEEALEYKLVAYDDSTSNQIAIVTLSTLIDPKGVEYEDEEIALKVLREWGVGQTGKNNGIVILIVKNKDNTERKIRIEVGSGLEGAVPDITSKNIIENDIVPNFRSDNYYQGLNAATSSIMLAAAGEYQAPAGYSNRGRRGGGISMGKIVIGLILLWVIMGMFGGGNNRGGGFMSRRGYRGFGGPVIFPGGFGGGGFGGGGGDFGGGGGGFGGFGGGSGGGGGASGSW